MQQQMIPNYRAIRRVLVALRADMTYLEGSLRTGNWAEARQASIGITQRAGWLVGQCEIGMANKGQAVDKSQDGGFPAIFVE